MVFTLTFYDLGHVGNTVALVDPRGRTLESPQDVLEEEDGDVNIIFLTVRNALVS